MERGGNRRQTHQELSAQGRSRQGHPSLSRTCAGAAAPSARLYDPLGATVAPQSAYAARAPQKLKRIALLRR